MSGQTYSQILQDAMDHFGTDAVVRTNAYDDNIVDHYNAGAADDDSRVSVLVDTVDRDGQTAQAWTVQVIDDDGYIQTNTDALATILSGDDYDRLGY